MNHAHSDYSIPTDTQSNRIHVRHWVDLSYAVYWTYRLTYHIQQWIFQRLTPLGVGVLILLIGTGLLGLWSLQSMCHRLFFLSLSLLTVSFISRHFIKLAFHIERIVPQFGRIGEPLRYPIHIKNLTHQAQTGIKSIEVIDTSYLEFHEFLKVYSPRITGSELSKRLKQTRAKRQWAIASLIDLPTLKIRGKTEITGNIIPLRRGRLKLQNLTLKATDPLGLSYQWVSYQHPQSVCILPQRYQLPSLFSETNPAEEKGAAVLTNTVGESLEFRSLRDYRPGDPTNKIHWKSWAKVGRPVVREQQDESTMHHGLLLDTFYSETYGEAFEEMVAIATSITMEVAIATSIVMETEYNTALLDVIFAGQELRCITAAGASSQQKELLLEMIATMNPCQSKAFQDLIPLAQSRFSRLSSCVCILIQWDSIRQTFLESLAQHDIPTKAIVICEGQKSHEEVRPMSLSHSCMVYFISIGQIQQDLLQL